ncbi:MAG: OmpH family outer membrane protein [Deltaproteobacteria bacterium]|nr:OmpH family outer membrane protein [Deltaproteobacteria bacterium]
MRMRVISILVLSVVALSFSRPGLAKGEKIGYVDLTRALNEIDEGKAVKRWLKKEFEKRQKALDEKQNDIKMAKKELDNLPPMVSDDVKKQKAQELQQKLYDLQVLYANLQNELAKLEEKKTKPIFEKMEKILSNIGKEQGFTLILEKTKSSILYAPAYLDLTNEMIRRYNLLTPKKGRKRTKKSK